MLSLGISSFFLAILDVKHYAQIQLKPHISRDHQVRTGTSTLLTWNSYSLHVLVLAPLYASSGIYKFDRIIRRRVALISDSNSYRTLLWFGKM
jgi:hypothetical protein